VYAKKPDAGDSRKFLKHGLKMLGLDVFENVDASDEIGSLRRPVFWERRIVRVILKFEPARLQGFAEIALACPVI